MSAEVSDQARVQRLEPPSGPVRMVLDTDTYNETDDQFALVHALLSPERLQVEAIYAAPFHNSRSTGPGHGMELSYQEILRLLGELQLPAEVPVERGSTDYLSGAGPGDSAAVRDLVARAMASPAEDPLYVVAIGAATNVASALLLEPEIAGRVVLVWLGGQALHWPDTAEFNLRQDVAAARVLLDCGAPLVLLPCLGVVSHLHTSVPEIERHVAPAGGIGRLLAQRFMEACASAPGGSKAIWDMAAVGYLIDPEWVATQLVSSPVLTDQLTWQLDGDRHQIRCATYVHRDRVLADLFAKLAEHTRQ